MIIGDDHGFPYYGFVGHGVVQTPALDELANEGTVFTNVHSTASACRPALNTLLTGMNPLQWQAELESLTKAGRVSRPNNAIEHVETLPRLLAQAGYASFQAGKYWEGSYRLAGFTDGMAKEEGLPDKVLSPSAHLLGRKTLAPVFEFIDAHTEQPFFLWFAPMLPHLPFDAPPRHRAPYEDRGLSAEAIGYFANCTWFDRVAGGLLAHLERKGLSKKTLVIYLSDNGWEQPLETSSQSPLGGERGKLSMFELGFRTPVIFRWPGHVPMDARIAGRASLVDVFATIADYAGVVSPPHLPGRSLRPAIDGKPWSPANASVGSMDVVRWSARRPRQPGARFGNHERAYYLSDDRWHYIWYAERNVEELYDKRVDPEMQTNVAGDHGSRTKQLRARVRRWRADLLRGWRTPVPRAQEKSAAANGRDGSAGSLGPGGLALMTSDATACRRASSDARCSSRSRLCILGRRESA